MATLPGMDVGMYGTPAPRPPQAVLNYSPPPPEVMGRLRDVDEILVRVRIVWEHDGEQLLEGVARRWWQSHVYVELDDRRLRTTGVWVPAADVRRR